MHDAGRSVPEDVSIIGFDDVPLAQFYTPALTTVRQDFKALGRVCFANLLSGLANGTREQRLRYPVAQLVIRESAGPPPKPSHRHATTLPAHGRAVPVNKRAFARLSKEK
jgi:DNA-binding LacI/PurR family transcriptional regulator